MEKVVVSIGGSILVPGNNDSEFIGNINPIRYRGYYFDTETNLYLINTDYFDPEICRYISSNTAFKPELNNQYKF